MFNKIISLFFYLDKNIKKQFFNLQILIFVNSILQLFVVFSVAPLVGVLSNNEDIMKKINIFYDFSYMGKQEQILLISIVSFIIFILANLSTTQIYILQQRFCANITIFFSNKLFEKFLNQDFKKKIQVHSSYYKSIIENDISNLSNKIVFPLVDLNSKIMPLIIITLSIFLINPTASIIIFTFLSLGYYLVYKMVKIKLKNNSKIITDNNFKINKILLETFNSLFEIKIYNFQNYIIKKFSLQKKKLSFASCNNMILSNSPKFFFEILAFFTVLFFILYQVEFTNNYNNTLAYTAIYIVAGYKIMPYLQAILFSFSNIKGSVESLNKIYLATKLKEEMSLINITNKIKKIQFQDFSYGYKNQNIFDNSNISLKINELTGIYGESGSGKTTLANLLIGYLKINKGLIKINDSIIDKSIYNIYNKVSYVPQRVNLLNESIITNVTFKNKLSSTETDKLKIILLKTQLKKFITKNKISKKKINENNKNISGGQAQRISIARALYKESDVIVFDEFTSNLDSNTEKKIFQKLKSVFKNKIVIIITHQEILKKYCSKVYKLENNKLNEI